MGRGFQIKFEERGGGGGMTFLPQHLQVRIINIYFLFFNLFFCFIDSMGRSGLSCLRRSGRSRGGRCSNREIWLRRYPRPCSGDRPRNLHCTANHPVWWTDAFHWRTTWNQTKIDQFVVQHSKNFQGISIYFFNAISYQKPNLNQMSHTTRLSTWKYFFIVKLTTRHRYLVYSWGK